VAYDRCFCSTDAPDAFDGRAHVVVRVHASHLRLNVVCHRHTRPARAHDHERHRQRRPHYKNARSRGDVSTALSTRRAFAAFPGQRLHRRPVAGRATPKTATMKTTCFQSCRSPPPHAYKTPHCPGQTDLRKPPQEEASREVGKTKPHQAGSNRTVSAEKAAWALSGEVKRPTETSPHLPGRHIVSRWAAWARGTQNSGALSPLKF
jgi:hypothetical protein